MRIKHIDILRGIAALMVTIFHLTVAGGLPQHTFDYAIYGWVGVLIFFVISGFVLPYSMFKTGYTVNKLGSFMLKRIVRIYPAYLAAIIIGLVLSIVTHRNDLEWRFLVSQLFFLNEAFGWPSISPVFWTLAIEFQFYLLIGLLFFMVKNNLKSLLLIMLLSIVSIWCSRGVILHWFPFFALGILIFNLRFTKMPVTTYSLATVLLFVVIWFGFALPGVLAAGFAVLFILFVKTDGNQTPTRFMIWLGTISYSLYLVHWELGRATVRVLRRVPLVANASLSKLFLGVCVSIICAFVMYLFIEKPSVKYAAEIKWKS